jgi:hypothetical protein
MGGLHPVDIAVVILYLVGVTFAGVWSGRFVKNMGDFFMPRRFGKACLRHWHCLGPGGGCSGANIQPWRLWDLVAMAVASGHAVLLAHRADHAQAPRRHDGGRVRTAL